MSNVLVYESILSDIASAIREKLETDETFKPWQFADAVRRIPGGPQNLLLHAATTFIRGLEIGKHTSELQSRI